MNQTKRRFSDSYHTSALILVFFSALYLRGQPLTSAAPGCRPPLPFPPSASRSRTAGSRICSPGFQVYFKSIIFSVPSAPPCGTGCWPPPPSIFIYYNLLLASLHLYSRPFPSTLSPPSLPPLSAGGGFVGQRSGGMGQ